MVVLDIVCFCLADFFVVIVCFSVVVQTGLELSFTVLGLHSVGTLIILCKSIRWSPNHTVEPCWTKLSDFQRSPLLSS